jgi:flagella basal body P-ring formation protein FlgA
MYPNRLIDAALRVLTAIDHGRPADEADLQMLESNAQPDEGALSMHELAGEVIKREIAQRRTVRAKR